MLEDRNKKHRKKLALCHLMERLDTETEQIADQVQEGKAYGEKDSFVIRLKVSELDLLKETVSCRTPQFVSELSHTGWFLCPMCHNMLDPEYSNYCRNCGQSLCWYGSVKHSKIVDIDVESMILDDSVYY